MFVLVGDVGGTNTRFLVYEVNGQLSTANMSSKTLGRLIVKKSYQNEHYASFFDVCSEFLKMASLSQTPVAACFAVAGPVQDNSVKFTNRDSWFMDGAQLSLQLNIAIVKLVNDFVANGYGLLTLDEETECRKLHGGDKQKSSPIACLGPGTGLGECFLTPNQNGTSYQCFPCEGGHAEFAPRNELEMSLLTFLKQKFAEKHRVSVERVVSGSGLANVYEFLCHAMPDKIDKDVHEKILGAGDLKGAVIAQHPSSFLCMKTMEIFVTSFGAEAGVVALKYLPYGGLYLTGGLTPKNIELIDRPHGPFLEAFLDKGRVSGLLHNIPVYAVMVEDLGVRGALLVAQQEMKNQQTIHKSQWKLASLLIPSMFLLAGFLRS